MPLQSSGPIKFSEIQTEFGGSNPISMSEYYKGGAYTTLNNSTIPTSGLIKASNFYSTYKTFTNAEIYNILASTDYVNNRNIFTSKVSFVDGLEASTTLAMDESGPVYRYSTSVTASYTWAVTAFSKLSYITVLIRNFASTASLVTSVTYNGTAYATTTINDANTMYPNRVTYVQIPIAYGVFNTGTLSVTYAKGSSNNVNLQEMYVFPGKWNLVSNNNVVAESPSSTAITTAVLANDILMGFRTRPVDASAPSSGTYSGVTVTSIMNRECHWYTDAGDRYAIATASGNVTFTPGSYSKITGGAGTSDSPYTYTTYYDAGQLMVFRLERA